MVLTNIGGVILLITIVICWQICYIVNRRMFFDSDNTDVQFTKYLYGVNALLVKYEEYLRFMLSTLEGRCEKSVERRQLLYISPENVVTYAPKVYFRNEVIKKATHFRMSHLITAFFEALLFYLFATVLCEELFYSVDFTWDKLVVLSSGVIYLYVTALKFSDDVLGGWNLDIYVNPLLRTFEGRKIVHDDMTQNHMPRLDFNAYVAAIGGRTFKREMFQSLWYTMLGILLVLTLYIK